MAFRKIIFDFDHTLVKFGPHVDWRRAIRDIESIYLEEGIPPAIVNQSKGLGFRLMRTVYDHMLEVYPQERVRQVQGRVFNALESHEFVGIEKATPLEGTGRVLSWMQSNDFQCAIVSSNGNGAIARILERLELGGFFMGIFGRDVSCRLKPSPEQNRACLTSLGWEAEETLLVGDSPDDVLSAKPLAIFTVGVVTGLAKQERLVEAGADRIIHSLKELPSVVETIQPTTDRNSE